MKFTKEYLLENYIKLNKSQRQIAEECNTTESSIDYWTRKYGLNYKKSEPDKVLNLIHVDKADPIFCYYAGLVATDGYLDYKHRRIALRVSNDGSLDVLNLIKNYFSYNIGSVYTYRIKHHELNIPSPKIFNELEGMGIFGDKNNRAFNIDWFFGSDEDCKRMFLRGILDGDGNIHKKTGTFRIAMKSVRFIENIIIIFNSMFNSGDLYSIREQKNGTGIIYPLHHARKHDSVDFYKYVYTGFPEYRFSDKYNRASLLIGKDIV